MAQMGGKNAAVVFGDADLEACINTLKRGSFINQGQVSIAQIITIVKFTIY